MTGHTATPAVGNTAAPKSRIKGLRFLYSRPAVVHAFVLWWSLSSPSELWASNPLGGGPRIGQTSADDRLPKEVDGLEVNEQLGSNIPRELSFLDQTGRTVRLGEFIGHGQPTLLTFNYARCPLLCHIQLEGLVAGLRELEWTIGQQFDIVTIVIDPTETPTRLKASHQRYMNLYGRGSVSSTGWRFLGGSEKSIRAAADAVGIAYRYLPDRREYVHPPAVVVLDGNGRIVRYLYGVEYKPSDLKLALLEATQGKIGNSVDRAVLNDFLMWCFHYDPASKSYSLQILRLMQAGGAVTLLALAVMLGWFWRREISHGITAKAADPVLATSVCAESISTTSAPSMNSVPVSTAASVAGLRTTHADDGPLAKSTVNPKPGA